METHFSFADGEHVTASVMEDDIEDDDKDDEEVELNFREECAADEALRFCWEGAVEGGGGGGRMTMFPLFEVLEVVTTTFLCKPPTDADGNISVGFLVFLSSIQSDEFIDAE